MSHFSVPDAPARIAAAIASGRLARVRVCSDTSVDVMTALVPEAANAGAGPGDGSWMAIFWDRGWPEWLVMLSLSLYLPEAAPDQAPSLPVAPPHPMAPADAAASAFAWELAESIAQPLEPLRAYCGYLALRLGSAPGAALATLRDLDESWSIQESAVAEVVVLLEQCAAGEEVSRESKRRVERGAREAAAAARDAASPSAESAAALCELAADVLSSWWGASPGGEVALLLLDAPSSDDWPSRVLACRRQLVEALGAASVEGRS